VPEVPPPIPPAGPGRYRRAAAALGTGLGFTLVFAGALVVSVLVHLDLGPTRRVAQSIANQILGSTFKGKIVVGEIDRLNLHGITLRSATAYDPAGLEVARLEGVYADTEVLGIVKSALTGGLRVDVPIIHIDSADVALEGGEGGLGIAQTFLLRKPGPPPPPNAIPPIVTLSRIEIDHVGAHGAIAPPTRVDADLHYVVGSVHVSGEGVKVDIAPVRLEATAPVPQPLVGDITFALRVPPSKHGAEGLPPHLQAGFEGKLGELDVRLDASMAGQHVEARVEVPRATPEVIATLVPNASKKLPPFAPVSLVAVAEGDLPHLDVDVRLDSEMGGSVEVGGKVTAAKPLRVDLGFSVNSLDPRVAVDVPDATPLDASGHVKLSLGDELAIEADAETRAFSIARTPIPGVKARAKLAKGKWSGSAEVDEPGAPTTATFTFDEKKTLRFEVKSDVGSLAAVKRLAGAPLDGAAQVTVKGTLKDSTLDATVEGRVDGLHASSAEIDHATIDARVEGPLDKLVLRDATVRGSGVRAANHAYDSVSVDASGPLLGGGSIRVQTTLDSKDEGLRAEASIDPAARAIRDIGVTIRTPTGKLEGKVERVSVTGRGVEIGKLALKGDGIGNMEGSLVVRGKELVGKLRGTEVDLAKLGKLARLSQPIAGLANIDVDLSSKRDGQRAGHVAVELVNAEAQGLSGLAGSLVATFEGDRVRVDGLARLIQHASPKDKPSERCDGSVANIRITGGRGTLGGGLLDPAAWKRLSGEVTVAAEDLNLRCLARLAPLPLDVRGKITARTTVELAPGARMPAVKSFLAQTRAVEIEGVDGYAWDAPDVDVTLKGSYDPKSNVLSARIKLDDGKPMFSFGGRTTIDLASFLDHPDQREAMLKSLPLSLKVKIPRRAVDAFGTLPTFVQKRLPPLDGEIELSGSIEGTPVDPKVEIAAKGWGVAHAYRAPKSKVKSGKYAPPPPDSPWGVPIDGGIDLRYDGKRATLRAKVAHDDKEIAKADVDLAIPLADALARRPLRPKGHAEVVLDRVPLGALPFLQDRGVRGHLSGKAEIAGLGEAPTVDVDLDIPDLAIGTDLTYDEAAIALHFRRSKGKSASPSRGNASASLTLSSKKGGKLTTRAFSDVIWTDLLVPGIDPNRPAELTLAADKFRIAALGPLLAGVASRVDGTLDGDARVGFTRLDDEDKAKIAVRLKLEDGLFHLPQLGQELHDAKLLLRGGGAGLVKLEGLEAYGTKGKLTGSGAARFKGLRFLRANATLEIKKDEKLPIAPNGVPLGDVYGKVVVHAAKTKKELAVKVGIPSFFLALPASTGRSTQSLDDNPDILILQAQPREQEETSKKPSSSRLALTFDIGDVGIKGNLGGAANIEVDVGLSGVKDAPLKVVVADKTEITGDIKFTRGRIVLLKRTFEIERGTMHMRPEDAGNPYLNVVARWASPEGDVAFEYVGVLLPVDKKKMKFTSPTLSETEIYMALLSGGAKSGSDVGSGTGQALLNQFIAQQFSTQLSDNISTSLGTSGDGSFRPGLVYTSGDKVIELSTYGASGQAAAGGGAALKGQRTQITVDWRFWRNWSVRGKVDAGSDQTLTGVDILWQYRY
jgi:translocation and assembly module TamB